VLNWQNRKILRLGFTRTQSSWKWIFPSGWITRHSEKQHVQIFPNKFLIFVTNLQRYRVALIVKFLNYWEGIDRYGNKVNFNFRSLDIFSYLRYGIIFDFHILRDYFMSLQRYRSRIREIVASLFGWFIRIITRRTGTGIGGACRLRLSAEPRFQYIYLVCYYPALALSPVTRNLRLLSSKSSVDRPSERNRSKARGILNALIVPQNETPQKLARVSLKNVSAPWRENIRSIHSIFKRSTLCVLLFDVSF
jgi:hypothetical protein